VENFLGKLAAYHIRKEFFPRNPALADDLLDQLLDKNGMQKQIPA
jgi:hypothetical protein